MKSQIKNKENGGITLEGTNYEQSSQNNNSTWCNLHEGFFLKKKLFMGGKPFRAKNI